LHKRNFKLKKKKLYYLLGAGGIGMSSIAQYLKAKGYDVFGFDNNYSVVTKLLEDKGIIMNYGNSIKSIQKINTNDNLEVIYSSAIKNDHPVFSYFVDKGFEPIKRAVFLASQVNSSESYAVSGTHGKTTTSAILAHIFNSSNLSFSAFVGGLMLPQNTNFINKGFQKTIVEADEYDRSFLNFKPFSACITSIDADHLDIYKNHQSVKEAFKNFAKKVTGNLIVHHSVPFVGLKYGININCDYQFTIRKQIDTGYFVDLKTPKEKILNIFCKVLGYHNLENMLAAIALADQSELELKKIVSCLDSFFGISRRLNIHEIENKIIIDDYAHHPKEIAAVHHTLRNLYPKYDIEVVFQPHLFSRTRDFMDDFAKELSKFDSIKVMEIYPAREEPINGINSEKLIDKLSKKATLLDSSDFDDNINFSKHKVLAILGAGDIGELIESYLNKKK
tara:strand:+ start:6174 stop:7517 length:1344 start_codon:yes stop_codon:yes gene_type:complete